MEQQKTRQSSISVKRPSGKQTLRSSIITIQSQTNTMSEEQLRKRKEELEEEIKRDPMEREIKCKGLLLQLQMTFKSITFNQLYSYYLLKGSYLKNKICLNNLLDYLFAKTTKLSPKQQSTVISINQKEQLFTHIIGLSQLLIDSENQQGKFLRAKCFNELAQVIEMKKQYITDIHNQHQLEIQRNEHKNRCQKILVELYNSLYLPAMEMMVQMTGKNMERNGVINIEERMQQKNYLKDIARVDIQLAKELEQTKTFD